MADEISLKTTVSLTNGSLKDRFESGTLTPDQTTQGAWMNVVSVGTSEEDLATSDITTPGWIMMKNLDATNFVTWGPKDTTMKALGKLEAGMVAVFYMASSVTLRWQADTAAVKVEIHVWEA